MAKKRKGKHRSITPDLADAADAEAMNATDLIRFKDLLSKHGIKPKKVTPAMADRADHLNAVAVRELVAKYEANKPAAEYQPPAWARVDDDTAAVEVSDKKKGAHDRIFGHKITAVIRWMGKDGWSFNDAFQTLALLDIDIAKSTIRTQLGAGKNDKRGGPAPLTKEQEEYLWDKADEANP